MMESLRIKPLMLLSFVVLYVYLDGCYGLIIQAGQSAEFNCSVDRIETSQWRVQRTDGSYEPIAQSGFVYSQHGGKFKLSTRNQSSGSNTSYQLSLILQECTADDDGRYLCEEEGQTRTETFLTVEISPVLHLEMNNTVVDTYIDVVSNQEATIACVAEGGKPPVTLSWRVNGKEKTGPFINNPPPSSERSVTSIIHYIPIIEDNTLTCVSSGQEVIPEKEVSIGVNVQYLPNCFMGITNSTNEFSITCSCKANPEVKMYKIYVNGSLFSKHMKIILPSEKSATVFCKASNDVGSFTTAPENLKPFHENVPIQTKTFLIIVVCVVVVLVPFAAIAIGLYVKMRKAEKRAKESEEKAKEMEEKWAKEMMERRSHWWSRWWPTGHSN